VLFKEHLTPTLAQLSPKVSQRFKRQVNNCYGDEQCHKALILVATNIAKKWQTTK
jgi:hypothetical protein